MNPQLQGIEELLGIRLFDLERSAKGLRLNRFMHDLCIPEKRELFKTDPETALDRAGLTDEERASIET